MDIKGTADVVKRQTSYLAPRTDGAVLRETLEALEVGANEQEALPRSVLDGVRGQAIQVAGTILGAFEEHVAKREVGPDGSGRASSAPPLREGCATGLLYGKVQSGKTLAMITATALALDNGFRIIIVLTSDNVSLVEQTAKRFGVLQGALVRSSDNVGSWLDDPDHVAVALEHGGLVLVTAKNVSHLKTFCKFLDDVGAANYPALILDDEADQASLDTNIRKRATAAARGDDPNDVAASKIFDWTNGEVSLRARLSHHIYLQVTATPYALLLQNMDSPLKPSFTEIIEPGDGYVGGDFFFDSTCFGLDGPRPPLCFVADHEADQLVRERTLPEGLELALAAFLVAAAAQGLAQPHKRFKAQNFLVHTSTRKVDHSAAAEMIRGRLGSLYKELVTPTADGAVSTFLEKGLREMARSVPALPPMADVRAYITRRLHDRDVLVVNSEKDNAKFGPRLNFIVGGNILGRGLTIDNLLITYYLRSAKVAQMDTMLQHARMFGYRRADQPYLRAFMPELQAARFEGIQRSERNLRTFLAEDPAGHAAVEVVPGTRPTRLNVLDPFQVEAFTPGEHIYATMPFVKRSARGVDVADSTTTHQDAYDKFVKTFYDGDYSMFARATGRSVADRLRDTSVDAVCDALDWIPYPHEIDRRGSWEPKVIKTLLKASQSRFEGRAYVYCRDASRTNITEGMMSSKELAELKGLGLPVLCLFWDKSSSKGKRGTLAEVTFPYLYPELVFPKTAQGKPLPTQVINLDGLREE